MKQTSCGTPLCSGMVQVTRFLVLAWWVWPLGWLSGHSGVQAYKLSESPINITNSQDPTVAQKVERLLEKNLLHDAGEANSMPEPNEGNGTNSSFGDLARNLEFLLLKVAQLETVVQLQQAELTAAHTEIDALKEHVGLDVQHVAMAQRKSRDPHAASEVLSKVLEKHHHQRETRNYDPDAHKDLEAEDHSEPPAAGAAAEGAAEALLQRQKQAKSSRKEAEASEKSLDESVSSKWIEDVYSSTVGQAVEQVSGTGLTPAALEDAFNQVKEQGNLKAVQFIQNTVIDTIEKATVILTSFRGFTFTQNCHAYAPSFSYHPNGAKLVINWGRLDCTVTLVGRMIRLFNTNWPAASVPLPNPLDHLPGQIRKVAGASQEMVDRLVDMSFDLLNTAHCNRGDTFHCMAKRVASYVMQFEPPLNWLPEPIKRVAAHTQEAVDRLFQMIHVLLNTAHCNRADSFHCMAKLVANHVMGFAPPMNFLPHQLHTVVNAGQEGVDRVFAMIRDLLNTPHCDRGNIFHCMAKKVANYVMEFAPPLNWLPQQLHTVVNAGQEGVDRVFAMIRDLLNTAHCNRGDTFHCMAKLVANHVMAFAPPINFMPSPVGVLAGSNVNSVKSLLAMGDDLMHCQNFESGHEVMKCLGFKIIERVPPLSYLNQLGDVIGGYLETFAEAATSVAMKALRGGTSLIEKASVSQFPPVGKMPVRHQQGNLVVEVHSQEMHPSLLQLLSGQGQQVVPMPKFEPGDEHVASLITQFNGREADSGSCLAFAPRTKNGANVGNHQEATKDDWTSAKKEDFVQLEPWAVPCDNTWMKENWNKWQGYSFYTSELAVEKCVTVKFALNIQPVVSVILGLTFELLPKELFEVITTVCWPNQMPGGLDLSVLRSEIKTAGHLLFSRTLRLAKRFGDDTDFSKKNLGTGYQTWRSPLGIAKGESRTAMEGMSLVDSNRSAQSQAEGGAKEKTESFYWRTEPEEVYLSSIDYGDSMEPNRTWEVRGEDAMLRLSEVQEARKQDREEVIELFNLKADSGKSNFHIQGLLDGNVVEMGVQMGFGPFQSPSRRVPLADIGVQFAVVLTAIPWISVETKKTAIAALKDFWPGHEEIVGPEPAAKSSMVAWFKSEDADSAWKSAVGSWQAHVTGSVTRKVEAGHGATYPVAYLTGDTNAGIDFGQIMKPDFTICSVTRYIGGVNQRILTHNQPNWLHGHWAGAVGVAHYNHWVTSPHRTPWKSPGLTGWLVMCGNSAGVVFRGKERRNDGETAALKSSGDAHLYINLHSGEKSDFGVMEVIVWNRALSEEEMWTSMEYLSSKLGPLPPQPADKSSMVAWFKSEDVSSAWKSAVGSWQGHSTRGSVTRKVVAGHGARFPVAYLAGGVHDGYDFGQIMKQDFTICSVTRYIEGGQQKRILQHNQPNWLHGHWAGKVGVTYYNTWVNEEGQLTGLTDWLVLCGNSAGVVFRGKERRNIAQRAPVMSDPDAHLYINDGHFTESSDFGVMEVIVWNRALSDEEMWTSMEYLNWKLSKAE
ncbi:pol [Symbiodinium sp. CCMP2456]|nr:pol [Symbiodinium sp. CCMP2456]